MTAARAHNTGSRKCVPADVGSDVENDIVRPQQLMKQRGCSGLELAFKQDGLKPTVLGKTELDLLARLRYGREFCGADQAKRQLL